MVELPAQAHSATSRAAARSMAQGAAPMRALVYRTLLLLGPMTDEELQDATGLGASTERPRRVELLDVGLVRDSGGRRPTRSGRLAVTWEAAMRLPVQLELEPLPRR